MISLAFLGTLPSLGSIELVEVINASNSVVDITNKSIKIFGGTSGTCTTGTSTCDSCATAAGLTACNPKMISSSTVMTVRFRVTSDLTQTGTVRVYEAGGNEVSISNASTGVTKGDTASFDVTWGTLCSHMQQAASDCSVSESETFTVGIDVDANGLADVESGQISFQVYKAGDTVTTCNDAGNTEGVCAFSANPGDGKVVIEDILTEGSFPTTSGLTFTHIRVYFKEGGFPSSPNDLFEDLGISQDSEGFFLSDKSVDGLTNNTPYFFRTASIDQAGNIGYFLHDNVISTACGASPTAADDLNCPYIATPAEVFGLLDEDLNCFIATAAFGSLWNSKVADLRRFRDHFLKPNLLRKKFVDWYYTYGPAWAKAIADNEAVRALVRVGLFPFWLFAKLAIDYGLLAAFVISFL
ncbi:MAG: hypothetical protein KDD61_12565, partial [Bdellovibrionales bacterium]|nr:hypothetical protein [Bdellovibrionales bacterium]